MKLLSTFFDRAPNKVFLSIMLGTLAGATYSLIIPMTLNVIAMDANAMAIVGSETRYFLWWQVSYFRFAILFVVACLVILVARTAAQVILTRVSLDVATDLRMGIYKRISSAPIADLERVGLPKLVASITSDVPHLIVGARLLPDLLTSGVTLMGMLGFLLYLNTGIFKFVMASILVGAFTYQVPMLIGRRYLLRARKHMDTLHESIRGLVYGAKELKLNSEKREDYFRLILEENERAVRGAGKTGNTIVRMAQNYGDLISFFIIGAVSFVVVNYHSISPQELGGVIMVLLYVTGPVAILLNFVPQFVAAQVALGRVNELFAQIPDEQADASTHARRNWSTLRFVGVRYQYQEKNGDPGFEVGPIDLEVRKGEIAFIVGGNGSGKSTLSKLLTLHYRPTDGNVLFDGEPVTSKNLSGFRRSIAAIFSDYHLFDRLLGLGDRDVQAEVQAHLAALGLDGKVRFEDGRFSTLSLSDGQRRRLALIAAYIEDADLYLFDEWAADQDPAFKTVFYNQILPQLKARGKAVIAISHDDRYYGIADRIFVMGEGRIERIDERDAWTPAPSMDATVVDVPEDEMPIESAATT